MQIQPNVQNETGFLVEFLGNSFNTRLFHRFCWFSVANSRNPSQSNRNMVSLNLIKQKSSQGMKRNPHKVYKNAREFLKVLTYIFIEKSILK